MPRPSARKSAATSRQWASNWKPKRRGCGRQKSGWKNCAPGTTAHPTRLIRRRAAYTKSMRKSPASRRARLEEERDGLEIPNLSELVRLESQINELGHQIAGQRDAFEQCEAALPTLEQSLQSAEETEEQVQQRVHQLDARLTALQSLQDQVSRSGELEPWLDRNDLRRNAHLWQGLRIREGWDDALEAVLRERLNRIR